MKWLTGMCRTHPITRRANGPMSHSLESGGKELRPRKVRPGFNPSLQGRNSRKKTVVWLHLPRAPGVVMTTSVLLGWWIMVVIRFYERDGYYILHGGPTQMLVITNMRDLAYPHHHISQHPISGYLRSDRSRGMYGWKVIWYHARRIWSRKMRGLK